MTAGAEDLASLRRRLHAGAEIADEEGGTAALVRDQLEATGPARIVTGLGGHGLAAVYPGREEGPRVLLRCELDALPIPETLDLPHASVTPGVSHKCGHDGHMTMIVGVARELGRAAPARGEVVLLFQPAEETGQGARRVIEDGKFGEIAPDRVFALHNLPGYPAGSVVIREGTFAAASRGMIITLEGATSHAAEPHEGRSPALAVAQIIETLSAAPQLMTSLSDSAKVTVIHARLGEVAFGTSPGSARVMATLRTYEDRVMDALVERCRESCTAIARAHDLDVHVSWAEEFPVTVNDPGSVRLVASRARSLGLDVVEARVPFAWSEDFGWFTREARGAIFGLGAGETVPALHHPTYDFPDGIIEAGVGVFVSVVRDILG